MYFAICCSDKANSLEIRMNNRPSHLKYLESLGGKVVLAGPFLDKNGSPSGSLIILNVSGADEAMEIASNDPYALAGLFSEVTIKPWKWVINSPE